MDISVIVVNYNTVRMTADCIDSIFSHSMGISFEVILIDNASTDGSKEFFECDSRVRYVYSYENMGFGRANNVGMMLAKGKYIFLLNSDTLLLNNALKFFYDYAESHKKSFYGSWLLDTSGNTIHSGGKIPSIRSELNLASLAYRSRLPILKNSKRIQRVLIDAIQSDETCQEVGYVTGADLFFHRDILKDCLWFDHNFFMYYEETDWQKRAKDKGIKSYLIKGPKVVHLHDFNKKISLKSELMRLQSNKYYHKKHNNLIAYYFYRIFLFFLRVLPVLCKPDLKIKDRFRLLYEYMK